MPSSSTMDPDERILPSWHREFVRATDKCTLDGADPAVQAQIEAELDTEARELDPEKRRLLTRALDRKLFEEGRFVMLGWLNYFYGALPEVKGYFLYDYFPYSNWSLYERVWLSE